MIKIIISTIFFKVLNFNFMVVSNLFACFVMVFCNNYMYLSGHINAQSLARSHFFPPNESEKIFIFELVQQKKILTDSEALNEYLKSMKIKKRIFNYLI